MPYRKLTLSFPALLLWISRVPIFGIVLPATAHSQSECSPTHPCMDQIGQQFCWELNSLSQLALQEKSVGHAE